MAPTGKMAGGRIEIFGADALKIRVYAYPVGGPYAHHAKTILITPRADEYFTWVTDWKDADFLYSPIDLGKIFWDAGIQGVHDFVRSLPHFSGREHRHFFHDYSAESGDWQLPSVLFRAVKSRKDPNPRTISVPHWVGDLFREPYGVRHDAYDICFVGRVNACDVRRIACQSVKQDPAIRDLTIEHDDFFGYIKEGTKKFILRRKGFIDAFKISKLGLCPRGVELDSYRFMECMSAGRVPVYIGDEWERPFEDVLDYRAFCFIVPEEDAARTNVRVKYFLTFGEKWLQEMATEARHVWLNWFRKEAIPMTYHHYLQRFL
jgi:hypothetical protein